MDSWKSKVHFVPPGPVSLCVDVTPQRRPSRVPLFLYFQLFDLHFDPKDFPSSFAFRMPRKRKHSSEEEDEDAEEELDNSYRSKRRAAIAARDRVAAKDSEDEEDDGEDAEEAEDDEDDEDYEGEEGEDDEGEGEEDEEEDEEDAGERKVQTKAGDNEEEEEEDDGDAEPVDCIEAELEEPSAGQFWRFSFLLFANRR